MCMNTKTKHFRFSESFSPCWHDLEGILLFSQVKKKEWKTEKNPCRELKSSLKSTHNQKQFHVSFSWNWIFSRALLYFRNFFLFMWKANKHSEQTWTLRTKPAMSPRLSSVGLKNPLSRWFASSSHSNQFVTYKKNVGNWELMKLEELN